MKLLKVFALAVTTSAAYVAHAQVPIAPFAGVVENFNAIAPTSYVSIPVFGTGTMTRIGTGGLIVVTNSAGLLPSLSPPNAIFGRGVNLSIQLPTVRKRFGGYFRVPFAGIAVTNAQFVFYRFGAPIALTSGAINNAGYLWYGWDISGIGGYDRVDIFGMGAPPGSPAGYVGMDNIVQA